MLAPLQVTNDEATTALVVAKVRESRHGLGAVYIEDSARIRCELCKVANERFNQECLTIYINLIALINENLITRKAYMIPFIG